jgi:hypothetical protein|nr:MAG: hypothetical protein [Bacteriophage sp.]
MIAVVKCYKHNVKPLVIEVFEGHDEQTQKDAFELAAILSRKNKCEYKVLIDLSCVAVINDSNWNSLLQYKHSLTETNE